jgi:hypothetical protein
MLIASAFQECVIVTNVWCVSEICHIYTNNEHIFKMHIGCQ